MRKTLILLLILLLAITPVSYWHVTAADKRITSSEQDQYRLIVGLVISAYRTKDSHQIVKVMVDATHQIIRVPIFHSLGYNRRIFIGDRLQVYGRVSNCYGGIRIL